MKNFILVLALLSGQNTLAVHCRTESISVPIKGGIGIGGTNFGGMRIYGSCLIIDGSEVGCWRGNYAECKLAKAIMMGQCDGDREGAKYVFKTECSPSSKSSSERPGRQ